MQPHSGLELFLPGNAPARERSVHAHGLRCLIEFEQAMVGYAQGAGRAQGLRKTPTAAELAEHIDPELTLRVKEGLKSR